MNLKLAIQVHNILLTHTTQVPCQYRNLHGFYTEWILLLWNNCDNSIKLKCTTVLHMLFVQFCDFSAKANRNFMYKQQVRWKLGACLCKQASPSPCPMAAREWRMVDVQAGAPIWGTPTSITAKYCLTICHQNDHKWPPRPLAVEHTFHCKLHLRNKCEYFCQ